MDIGVLSIVCVQARVLTSRLRGSSSYSSLLALLLTDFIFPFLLHISFTPCSTHTLLFPPPTSSSRFSLLSSHHHPSSVRPPPRYRMPLLPSCSCMMAAVFTVMILLAINADLTIAQPSSEDKNRVFHDSEIPGGTWRRKLDQEWSEKFGGYRALQQGTVSEPSAYGKYVEPVFHAAEHTYRAVQKSSMKELGRAKDELLTFGQGLHTKEDKYQTQYGKKK
eukprot:m.32840 g.32840  ORF g.32840 m.32840 type:complete len:221 (-) comp10830_c0_seq2:222-884(-)